MVSISGKYNCHIDSFILSTTFFLSTYYPADPMLRCWDSMVKKTNVTAVVCKLTGLKVEQALE